MEGIIDNVRCFFKRIGISIAKVLPLGKPSSHIKVLDSNGLIDESLYQGEAITPEVTVREVTVTEVPVKALTELE